MSLCFSVFVGIRVIPLVLALLMKTNKVLFFKVQAGQMGLTMHRGLPSGGYGGVEKGRPTFLPPTLLPLLQTCTCLFHLDTIN